MKKTKILFAGIGGVGGYFGGMLAHFYHENEKVVIGFFARAAQVEIIRLEGLKVIQGQNHLNARPRICTDSATEVGAVDYIFICTKTYDLQNIVENLADCIDQETVLITLLNGPINHQLIQEFYPNNLVLNGCVYIVSRLIRPGVVENTGNIQKLFFGKDAYTDEKVLHLESLLQKANIDATYTQSISQICWEKFIFLSPIASATASMNASVGELLSNNEQLHFIKALIGEIIAIAKAKGITLPTDILEQTVKKLKSLPFQTTTSMHSDLLAKKPKTEFDALTDFVIREGRKMGIETTQYVKASNLITNHLNYRQS
jgi:2-dehydropantoate 2-reductase